MVYTLTMTTARGLPTIAVAKRLDPQEAIVGLKGKESNGV